MNLLIENLTKSFGEKSVLRNFSYTFTSPGLYVITGESGIGKTTLLRLIAGLDNDYTGKITNGGISNTSFMFQEYRLFPKLNALDNVLIAEQKVTEDSKKKARELLINLKFPEEAITKKPDELSGGMKQRVAFARSIMKNSPVLLLDEPTKELDKDTLGSIVKTINEESQKRIVIVVTHDTIENLWDRFEHIKL